MTTFGFGQKMGQVIQTAYIVEDMETAIDWWVKDARTGPWFLLESFLGEGQIYPRCTVGGRCANRDGLCRAHADRADPAEGRSPVGLSRSGAGARIWVSSRRDRLRGMSTPRWLNTRRADTAWHFVRRFRPVVRWRISTDPPTPPGFVELIPATEGMDAAFTEFWRASVDLGWQRSRQTLRLIIFHLHLNPKDCLLCIQVEGRRAKAQVGPAG